MIKKMAFLLFFILVLPLCMAGTGMAQTTGPGEEMKAQEEKGKPAGDCLNPFIIKLYPDRGKPGDQVRIKGRRFRLEKGKVTFNGIPAEIIAWRMENIYVKVPEEAKTGPLIVDNGCEKSNGLPFTVER